MRLLQPYQTRALAIDSTVKALMQAKSHNLSANRLKQPPGLNSAYMILHCSGAPFLSGLSLIISPETHSKYHESDISPFGGPKA